MGKDFPRKWSLKQAEVAIVISDKADIKPKLARRNQEGHFLLLKGAIHQEHIAIVNIYTSNVSVSSFIRQLLLNIKAQIGTNPIIVGDFKPTPTNRSSR
jgi:hypothetical protein